ncbi:MAG: CHAT domain-containing protein [Cyanobacteria bacterium J06554_6]
MLTATSLCSSAYGQGAEELAPYYRAIVEAYEANPVDPAARSWEAVDTLNGAGIAYRYLGDPQKAWELHQQALIIAWEIGDLNREISTLQNLGNTASQLGDDQGINFYQSQLAIVRDRGDLELEASLLQLLSFGYSSIGDTQALLELYEDYIPLLQQLERREDAVYALIGKASLYYGTLSQPQQAFALLEEALAIAHQANNPNLLRTALINQGSFYRLSGDFAKVIEVYEQALDLTDQSGTYQDRLLLQQQLAHAYEAQDNVAEAISLHRANLALARQQADTIWTAWSMDDLSFAYRQLQDYEQALDWQLQALALHLQVADGNMLSQFNGYNNLGWIYFALGDLSAAEQSLQNAIQGYEGISTDLQDNQGLFGQSNDDLQINVREGFADAYQALQAVLVARGKVEDALEVAEQGRARSIVNLLSLKTTGDASAPVPNIPASNIPVPNIEELRAIARSHNTTLVEYSVLYDQPRMAVGNRLRRPPVEKTLLIWVIKPTGDITLRQVDLQQIWQQSTRDINFETPLGNLIQDSRQALGIPGRGFDLEWRAENISEKALIPELRLLHQLLIDPIADLLPSEPTETVTFIPQDMLFFTPFAALQDRSGSFLIEHHTPVTAPSIQFLALTEARQQQLNSLPTAPTALVVGNPTMPQVRLEINGPWQQLPVLPGAEIEADAIARLLETRPLIGAAATEAAVVNQLPAARIIHLATHGLLDPVYGFQSALALAPGSGEDGLLKTREIINLDLQADLVVLSACDTGRGRLTGDGVIGLARSFIGAGVPSIVVSLWAIPDAPTAKLMTEFYQQLDQGGSKAQALRQAMLETLETHPHPRNWAAFTLIGEAN